MRHIYTIFDKRGNIAQQYDTRIEAERFIARQNEYWRKQYMIIESEYDEHDPDCVNNFHVLSVTKLAEQPRRLT